jgi:hypothetical protein
MVEPANGLARASEACACAATALTVKKSNDRAAMEIRIARVPKANISLCPTCSFLCCTCVCLTATGTEKQS